MINNLQYVVRYVYLNSSKMCLEIFHLNERHKNIDELTIEPY